ncbi:NYN domain-containing protein [Aquariibacter albus]|uniref:NYN domain-containing protein n=1 Tax=Aquariibacter albus TaxID=2759899 RepID=A0A839HPY5_9BURK|nr:NYN domain-containing protein [Aquariibacter albus]MBB1161490.1 NYN domain-containing protein [Aquariibacter albus]
MLSYAILIDGGFAKRKIGTAKAPATAESFRSLVAQLQQHEALAGMRMHRVYYYDSMPLETAHQKPLGGELVEFGASPTAARARNLFEQLAQLPFMALRLGELAFQGWELSAKKLGNAVGPSVEVKPDDLRPQITQKGVDMRIGMDIAALTLKRQVQVIVLVTGDSDFVPAMKFARREGAHLYLCPLGQRVKPSMLEHSDLCFDLPPAN